MMSLVEQQEPTFLQVLVRNIQIMVSKNSLPNQITEANKFFVNVLMGGKVSLGVIFQLIQPQRSPEFHHYGLRILESNIRINWKNNYNPDMKRRVWQLLLKYGSQVGPSVNFVKEKFASVVTYILLRDWPDPSPQIFGGLVTELLNNKRVDLCLRVLNSFCQDLSNEYSIDVNIKRQKRIRSEFMKTMCQRILSFYIQNLNTRICVIQTVINIQNFSFICQESHVLQFAPLVYQVLKSARSPADKAAAMSCMNRLSERIEGQSNVFLSNVVMKANPTDFHEREMLFHILSHFTRKKATVKSLDPIKFFAYFSNFSRIPRKFLSEKQMKDMVSILLNFLKGRYGVAKSAETLENEKKMELRSQLNRFKKTKNRMRRNRKGELNPGTNEQPIPQKIIENLFPVFQNIIALAVRPPNGPPCPNQVKSSLRLLFDWILLHNQIPLLFKEKIYLFLWNQMFNFQKLQSVHQFRVVCDLFIWGKKYYPFDVKVKNVDKFHSLLKQIVSYLTNPDQIRKVEEEEKARQISIFQKRQVQQSSNEQQQQPQQQRRSNSTFSLPDETISLKNDSLPGPYVNFIRLLRHFDSCYKSEPNSLRVVITELFKILFRLQFVSLKNVILDEWLEFCRSYPQILFRFFQDLMGIQQRMIQNETSVTSSTNLQLQQLQQPQMLSLTGGGGGGGGGNNHQIMPFQNNNNQLALLSPQQQQQQQQQQQTTQRPGTFSLDEIMKYMEGCVMVADKSPNDQQKQRFLSFLLERPIQMFVHQNNRAKMSSCNDLLKGLMARGDQEEVVRSLVLFTAVCKRVKKTQVISGRYFLKILPVLLELIKTIHTIYHPRYLQSIPKNVYLRIVWHQFDTFGVYPTNVLFHKMKKSVYFILGYCARNVPEFWSNQNLVNELSTSVFHNFDHLNIVDLNKLVKYFIIPFTKHIPKSSLPMLQNILMPILMNSLKSISERLKKKGLLQSQLGMDQTQKSMDQETWHNRLESKLYCNLGRLFSLFTSDLTLHQFLKRSDALYMSICDITLNLLYNSSTLKFFYIYKEFFEKTLEDFYKNRRFEQIVAFHLLKALVLQLNKCRDCINQNELVTVISKIFVLYAPVSKFPNYIFSAIHRPGLSVLTSQLQEGNMLKASFKSKKKKIKAFLKIIMGKNVNLNILDIGLNNIN